MGPVQTSDIWSLILDSSIRRCMQVAATYNASLLWCEMCEILVNFIKFKFKFNMRIYFSAPPTIRPMTHNNKNL